MATGLAGAFFEAGFPDSREAALLGAFVIEHKGMLVQQSLAFSLSSTLLLLLVVGLKVRIVRPGGGPYFADCAFGTAVIWIGLQIAAQCLQIGVAIGTTPEAPINLGVLSAAATMLTLSGIAGAAFLAALAAGVLIDRRMPVWFGVLSLIAALVQLLIWMTAAVESGPFSPVGWTAYVLQPFFLVWLVPASILLLRDQPRAAEAP